MQTGAKNAMFYLFFSKPFILRLMLVFQNDQIGKLFDLLGCFGFNSRTMNGKSVKIYLYGISIIQSVRSKFALPYKRFDVLLTFS